MTPFLTGFADALLDALLEAGAVEIAEGQRDRAVVFVANWLGTRSMGSSLISSIEAGLIACPEVEEVYADLDHLKAIVDDLGEPAVR